MTAKADETNLKTQRTFYKLWKILRDSSPKIWQGNHQKHSSVGVRVRWYKWIIDCKQEDGNLFL